jgi:chorismate mutase/prephenate dehydrogenase
MSIVQVLLHYQTQVLGLTLANTGMPLEESLAFTSPAYLLEAYVAARHFAQDSALYGPIEMENPARREIVDAFRAAAAEIGEILEAGDQARFDAVFEKVRAYFGEFTAEALEQSGFLIDRLIELTTGRAAAQTT